MSKGFLRSGFSGNDEVKTETFQFTNDDGPMEYVNSLNMRHAKSLTYRSKSKPFPAIFFCQKVPRPVVDDILVAFETFLIH